MLSFVIGFSETNRVGFWKWTDCLVWIEVLAGWLNEVFWWTTWIEYSEELWDAIEGFLILRLSALMVKKAKNKLLSSSFSITISIQGVIEFSNEVLALLC